MLNLRLAIASVTAKTVTTLIRGLKISAASVMPGAIARRLAPQILAQLCDQVAQGVIVIVGTNGKTTTSALIRAMLQDQGYRLAHNATGANLINGLITALLEQANLWGQLAVDYAVLEVDENILPLLLKNATPQYILALNLFRDQLDRYGEVDLIAQRWQTAIAPLPPETTLIINGDDPTLSALGQQLQRESGQRVLFFGLSEPQLYLNTIPHAVDSIYCPQCGAPLRYDGVYISHLGDFSCPSCDFAKAPLQIDSNQWPQILIGVYNKYNTLAAVLLAQQLGSDRPALLPTIQNFKAAFGRAEELTVGEKKVRILLSKNPVGMNETIRAVADLQRQGQASSTLLVLNDRTPDGTDVSWIWDVDMEDLISLGGTVVVSGDRTHDMALRVQYAQPELPGEITLKVVEPLDQAIAQALEATPPHQTLHIIPTYSAMLEVRQVLTGRKIP